jgi:hypothetical protein
MGFILGIYVCDASIQSQSSRQKETGDAGRDGAEGRQQLWVKVRKGGGFWGSLRMEEGV